MKRHRVDDATVERLTKVLYQAQWDRLQTVINEGFDKVPLIDEQAVSDIHAVLTELRETHLIIPIPRDSAK